MPKTSICPTCGMSKDYRAQECISCGMSRKARKQWANGAVREKMVKSLRIVHGRKRLHYSDISEGITWQYRTDGRVWIWFWDGDRKRTIYRYQWRWQQANGPIPPGHAIHHINEDCSDDRLENLMCLSLSDHTTLHMDRDQKQRLLEGRGLRLLEPMSAVCTWCSKEFRIRSRTKVNRFCSLDCYHQSQAQHQPTVVCPTCGKTFRAGTDHGRDRKYCSRKCFDKRGA